MHYSTVRAKSQPSGYSQQRNIGILNRSAHGLDDDLQLPKSDPSRFDGVKKKAKSIEPNEHLWKINTRGLLTNAVWNQPFQRCSKMNFLQHFYSCMEVESGLFQYLFHWSARSFFIQNDLSCNLTLISVTVNMRLKWPPLVQIRLNQILISIKQIILKIFLTTFISQPRWLLSLESHLSKN